VVEDLRSKSEEVAGGGGTIVLLQEKQKIKRII